MFIIPGMDYTQVNHINFIEIKVPTNISIFIFTDVLLLMFSDVLSLSLSTQFGAALPELPH